MSSAVTAKEVVETIKKAEELLGQYRYNNRPFSDPRQKGLVTAENLLTEARLKIEPKLVKCEKCDGSGKVPEWR